MSEEKPKLIAGKSWGNDIHVNENTPLSTILKTNDAFYARGVWGKSGGTHFSVVSIEYLKKNGKPKAFSLSCPAGHDRQEIERQTAHKLNHDRFYNNNGKTFIERADVVHEVIFC